MHADRRQSSWIRRLREDAERLGFCAVGIAPAGGGDEAGKRLREFIRLGRHGDMEWMAATFARRQSPRRMWSDAKSAIVLAMNYGPDTDPLEDIRKKKAGNISVYARNRDYHDLIKGRLKEIAMRFASASGAAVKVFVDTAPLMEKPLAQAAGIGWQGKHTNLVSRQHGSWLFLGVILTDAELVPDKGDSDHCGTCRACLDICPTQAFPAPYQLDARRCISYLTIEHRGAIPRRFRTAIGNRIFGCDDCLAICPWNKYAHRASETRLRAREDLGEPQLLELLGLDDSAFRKKFSGSPVKRIGRDRFMRNVLIAAGNSGDTALAPSCLEHAVDPNPIVRGAAVWALSRLLDRGTFEKTVGPLEENEKDADVRTEFTARETSP